MRILECEILKGTRIETDNSSTAQCAHSSTTDTANIEEMAALFSHFVFEHFK